MSNLPDLDSGAVILRLSDRVKDQADRIKALEAALREALARCVDHDVYRILDAALAPKQDK